MFQIDTNPFHSSNPKYNPSVHYYYRKVDDEITLCNLVSSNCTKLINANQPSLPREETNYNLLKDLIDRNEEYLSEFIPSITSMTQPTALYAYLDGCNQHFFNSIPKEVSLTSAIWYKGSLVGLVAVQKYESGSFSCEVGYWIGAEFQGKGIAYRAVVAFCRELFQKYPIDEEDEGSGMIVKCFVNKIMFKVSCDNLKSIKLCEKMKCTREGHLRSHEYYHSSFHDIYLYSLLRSDMD